MISNYTTKELRYKSFNRFSKFVLIGNNVDGYINVNLIEFDNFEKVKKELPHIINTLYFEGEWNLSLYQVPANYKIRYMYDYYKVPSRGKLILELTYMNVSEKVGIFISDAIIHVFSTTGIIAENYDLTLNITEGKEFKDYITVLLYEETRDIKTITSETYFFD